MAKVTRPMQATKPAFPINMGDALPPSYFADHRSVQARGAAAAPPSTSSSSTDAAYMDRKLLALERFERLYEGAIAKSSVVMQHSQAMSITIGVLLIIFAFIGLIASVLDFVALSITWPLLAIGITAACAVVFASLAVWSGMAYPIFIVAIADFGFAVVCGIYMIIYFMQAIWCVVNAEDTCSDGLSTTVALTSAIAVGVGGAFGLMLAPQLQALSNAAACLENDTDVFQRARSAALTQLADHVPSNPDMQARREQLFYRRGLYSTLLNQ